MAAQIKVRKTDKLFAISEDPNQMSHSATDLGLHCLPITLLGAPNCNGIMREKITLGRIKKIFVFRVTWNFKIRTVGWKIFLFFF